VNVRRSVSRARVVALIGLLALTAPLATLASQATPIVSTEGITLAASGLVNPRGFTWGADGSFYVTEAGTGGLPPVGAAPVASGMVSAGGGLTGSVSYVDGGCAATFAGDLPSTIGTTGSVRGPAAVALLDNRVYVAIAGGGPTNDNPTTPNGIYALDGDGSAILVADLGAWMATNPVSVVPGDYSPEGDPFAMVAGDDELWLVEANSGQLLRVTTDGSISRLVDFSVGTHEVPTGLALEPDGGVYIGFLTPGPHLDGTAKVIKVEPDGTVSDYWTGLTMVTWQAVTPDGTQYATERATGNQTTEPNILPNTGRLVRQTGSASLDVVVSGMDYPISIGLGPDNGLYLSMPAIATDGDLGGIVRIDPTLAGPVTMPAGLFANSTRAPVVNAEGTPGAGVASPETVPASTDATPEPAVAGTRHPTTPATNRVSRRWPSASRARPSRPPRFRSRSARSWPGPTSTAVRTPSHRPMGHSTPAPSIPAGHGFMPSIQPAPLRTPAPPTQGCGQRSSSAE